MSALREFEGFNTRWKIASDDVILSTFKKKRWTINTKWFDLKSCE